MPTTQLQFRRGNTAQTSVFTGAIGEVTVDTDRKTLTVHDGVTVGGTYVATNIQLTSAYGKANAANVLAQAGFDQANSGFNKANSANVLAQNAYDASNTVNVYAYSAYSTANSAQSNTVITQGVDSTQNTNITTATNLAQGAFTSANTRANAFFGTSGSATPAGGGITFNSTNGITISGTSSTLTISSPQDLQSTATPTFKGISFANTATGNRGIVQASTSSTAQTAIDTWSTSTYRTAKYIVSMSSGANYHAIELLIIHNGTTPTITQYAEVIIGSSLATFDASIASTTLTLLANPATTSSITYNLLRDNIGA